MVRETETFFDGIVRGDRSILELLDADYTYVNEDLARFYGILNVVGPKFRRVSLEGTHRRGILGHEIAFLHPVATGGVLAELVGRG